MTEHFDYLVLGGGSGGIASARRAALHGARVAVVEHGRMGGTCVNVGCVPKKVMWNTAQLADALDQAAAYGFRVHSTEFDWATIKQARDAYVARLNDIYHRNLDNVGVTKIIGHGRFVDPRTVEVESERFTADHILIATGGYPVVPQVPGSELGITSDGFFELERQPQRVAIVGAGYIATEFAGVLHGLGSEVTQVLRKEKVLRTFDHDLHDLVMTEMQASGVRFETRFQTRQLTAATDGRITVHAEDGRTLDGLDCVIWAVGRRASTADLGLENAGIELDDNGYVDTDAYQNASVPGVYAVGDVSGRIELTPVAIAAGRRLADRLFNADNEARLDYENVPSVVFSHPPIGTVGLSEENAVERFGESSVKVYKNRFVNMYYAPLEHKAPSLVKLVVTGDDEKVVGCHIAGDFADEMIQGFSVAVKMGATKKDFDNTVAIHPTAGEELVTLT